jgi:hypothetical protein
VLKKYEPNLFVKRKKTLNYAAGRERFLSLAEI